MIKVLVADHSRACLYETASYGASLKQMSALINPAAHLSEHELGTSAPGRVFNRASGAHQAYAQQDRFRANAAQQFAREIGELLEASLRSGKCAGVVLIAAPRFLGELRRAMPQYVRRQLLGQIPKDLAKRPAPYIARQLRNARNDRRLPVAMAALGH